MSLCVLSIASVYNAKNQLYIQIFLNDLQAVRIFLELFMLGFHGKPRRLKQENNLHHKNII